jgi:small GTP-binding protein
MTIGVDFSVTQCKTESGQNVTLQIWDFGGENRFRSLLPSFCLGASGCLMLFDPLRPVTFHELDEWVDIVKTNTKDVPILLLSSKHDLIDDGHPFSVAKSDLEGFIEKHKMNGYMPVSSKNGMNVQDAFTKISEMMITKNAR